MKTTSDRYRKFGGGFTLIEVMAAILFVAIILPTAMRGISLATSMISDASKSRLAVMLAEQKICEILLEDNLAASSQSGDFDGDYDGFNWSCTTEATDIASLTELNLTVTWRHREYERSLTLTTFVYEQE